MSTNEPTSGAIESTRKGARTMSKHPDTIGEVEWDGKTYQVDWPFDLNDETTRDESLGVIYLDGEQVAEFNEPFGPLTDEGQVMHIAREYIINGETSDQA